MTVQSYDSFFINNSWVRPSTKERLSVINPATESAIATVPEASKEDVDAAVLAARNAFDHGPWPSMTGEQRGNCIKELSQALQQDLPDLAQLITQEMGSPITFSMRSQAFSPIIVLDYYADLARKHAFEVKRPGMVSPVVCRSEPVGVVAAITPWNAPLFTMMLKLAPALAAGCTVVIKPAPETPLDAYRLAEAIEKTSIPPGVVNIIPAGREVGEYLVSHRQVDKVSFTGSVVAGSKIGSICGSQIKRCTLELGGKSAAILLDDVDLTATIPQLLPAALMNNGQACIAQTRVLAPARRYREIVDTLTDAVANLRVGDPLNETTDIGPLFAERQRERVESYIEIGKAEGARVSTGGKRPSHLEKGWYVEPTVFVDVDNSMRIAREEIFGPVVSVIPYDNEENAVAIANDSDYGLSGTVWTRDAEKGLDIARKIRTGTYTVNGMSMDFMSPFGGFKQSGIGRELGQEGLNAYFEYKTINMPADYKI